MRNELFDIRSLKFFLVVVHEQSTKCSSYQRKWNCKRGSKKKSLIFAFVSVVWLIFLRLNSHMLQCYTWTPHHIYSCLMEIQRKTLWAEDFPRIKFFLTSPHTLNTFYECGTCSLLSIYWVVKRGLRVALAYTIVFIRNSLFGVSEIFEDIEIREGEGE